MRGQQHLPHPFPPAERTLPAMLQRQAERFGERRLFAAGGECWTFAEAPAIAAGHAGALAEAGIRAGDRVAILCGNRPEFLRLFLGCAWLGAVAVPINTASKGPQIAYLLANSGAKLLVVERELLPALEHAELSGLPLERVWVVDGTAGETVHGRPAVPFPPPAAPVPAATVRPGDTLAILYTSGTTGPSKGVCCPHAQYFWWGAVSARLLGVRDGDVLCTTLPLFHINALNGFSQALVTGTTQVVEPRFSASGFWAAMARHGATVIYLLGAMVPILLSRPPSPEERAHRVRVALGPGVPGHLHAQFTDRTGVALLDGYGSTETNFVIGATQGEHRAGSMGRAVEGFQARVVDGDDNELPPGEAGELVLRADEPFAFATGYFGMDDKTVEAWRNLWFHTGDRVVREADGSFRFVDRLKDAIRRRGENISSFEVEQVLLSHPAIATAAVYPVRSELAEDEVMAAIVLRPGASLPPAELMAFCEPRMPYFAVPRFVEFLDELPRTENGKVQKYKLRDRGITPAAWDREAHGYVLKRR